MLIWIKMGCNLTCSIYYWILSLSDTKAGVPCNIVSRKMWRDGGMIKHGGKPCICAGPVLKWRGIKARRKEPENAIWCIQTDSVWICHKPSHASWASAIFLTFSIYAEQSCLVIVPAANFCHLLQQSFVFRIKVDLPHRIMSMIPCGIPTHKDIKCWKESYLYSKLVSVVVYVPWETVCWSTIAPSWTLPYSFWGYWPPHFLISFKCLQIYKNNEGYFTLFRYIVSFLPFLVSEVTTFKRKTKQYSPIR